MNFFACKFTYANAPFVKFVMVDLITDGFQVALLWERGQKSLHAAVELLFTIKLKNKEKEQRIRQQNE